MATFKAISLHLEKGKIESISAGEVLILDGSQRVMENMIIEGDLTVLGAATEIITTETKIADPIIDFGMEDDGSGSLIAPTAAAGAVSEYGMQFHYWDGVAAAIASIKFDKTTSKWTFNPGMIVSDLEGNASTATALETPRDFSIAGEVVASAVSFDGTANVVLNATIPQGTVQLGGHTSGAYVESLVENSPYLSIADASSADGAQLTLSMAAASANTVDTLVARDANGDFSARHITADRFIGLADRATVLENPRDFSMSGDVVAPAISFDGSGNVALSATIQPQAVEFGMVDPAAYRDSAEGIREPSLASDTEFATEKAISDALGAQSSALEAELDATQLQIGMVNDASATAGNGGYYLAALAMPGVSPNGVDLFATANYAAGQTLVASLEKVMADVQAAADQLIDTDQAIQSELDETQLGAGLDTDGKYSANVLANYVAAATSLKDADNKLDAAIKVNFDAIAALDVRVTANEGDIAQLELDLAQEVSDRTVADQGLQAQITSNDGEIAALEANQLKIETAAGLAADGSFVAHSGTTYINSSTSMKEVDAALDSAIAQEVSDRASAITAIKFVGIGSSNQSSFSPLVLTMEDLDASLTEADLRLAANHGKRLGFAVKGTALTNNYMVIDANGTSKDFEWSMSIEEDHTAFPAVGDAAHGTFASTQAIVEYVAQELAVLNTQIQNSSNFDYQVKEHANVVAGSEVNGTLDFANSEVFKFQGSEMGVKVSADAGTDTLTFELTPEIAVDKVYASEMIQELGAGSVAQYELLKADLSKPTDNMERVIGMSAGVSPDGSQLMYVNGQILSGVANGGSWAVGAAIFVGDTGSLTDVAPAYVNGKELTEVGVWTSQGLMLNVRHILTY